MPVNQQGDSPLNGLVSTVVLRASAPLEVIKTTVRNVLLRALIALQQHGSIQFQNRVELCSVGSVLSELKASDDASAVEQLIRDFFAAHPDAEPMRVFVEESCFQTA